MYKIVKAPHVILTAKAKRITKVDAKTKKIIEQMTATLENARDPEGVGLAAPQVGLPLQLFVVKESNTSPVLVIMNPKIIEVKDKKLPKRKRKKEGDVKLEGCLSLQDIWGVVKRHDSVTIHFMDATGLEHTQTFTGFLATIMQHECDHLEGILFPKRVFEQNGTLYRSKTNEKGEMVFDEISL
jgi:peptide deformylase